MHEQHVDPLGLPRLLAGTDRWLALTAIVIGLAHGEPARVLKPEPPSLRSRLVRLFGRPRPNGLADARLELLRAVAAGLRDRRRPLDPALRNVARGSGLGDAGIEWVDRIVAGLVATPVRRPSRRTKRLRIALFRIRR